MGAIISRNIRNLGALKGHTHQLWAHEQDQRDWVLAASGTDAGELERIGGMLARTDHLLADQFAVIAQGDEDKDVPARLVATAWVVGAEREMNWHRPGDILGFFQLGLAFVQVEAELARWGAGNGGE